MVVRLLCGFQGILLLLGVCLECSVSLLWCFEWLSGYAMVSRVFCCYYVVVGVFWMVVRLICGY